jgi:virulence-associated protein VagC
MQKTAEIFIDHGRQAVRLPEGLCFSGDRVNVRRDEETGDVILFESSEATKPKTLESFFKLLDGLTPEERVELASFEMVRETRPPEPRDLF